MHIAQLFVATVAALSASFLVDAQQVVSDPDFNVSVKTPAYAGEHPRVVIDEAHHNYHTMEGHYRPLAQLLTNDGYNVTPGTAQFTATTLLPATVLVVSNARGGEGPPTAAQPAFTVSECDAVQQWVGAGGALLLIADHAPFGSAAHDLAARFGIDMGQGYAFDPENSDSDPTFLLFGQENGLLGDHPVTRGRNKSERVRRIVAFTGQSLSIPPGATALMRFASSALEVASYADIDSILARHNHGAEVSPTAGHVRSVAHRAQGVALVFGKGRVIVMGEAAMFSAQVLKSNNSGEADLRFGMNAPGNDDRQFALNALHWLSRAIP
jgi:hypothetical protein